MLIGSVTYRKLELPILQGSYLITTTINYKGLHYSLRLVLSCNGFCTLAILYPYCMNDHLKMCTPMLRSKCFLESEYWGCSSEASFVHSGDLRVLFYVSVRGPLSAHGSLGDRNNDFREAPLCTTEGRNSR